MEAMTDQPFQVMAKPIGPRCNLDCTYCYYLEKEKLYPETKTFEMQLDVLETYIRDFIASQVRLKVPEIWFNWQGGEPIILGLAYFRRSTTQFVKHARPYLGTMVKLIKEGRQASDIMHLINSGQIRGANTLKPASAPSRNAPCPCGSGRKFKHCCGK